MFCRPIGDSLHLCVLRSAYALGRKPWAGCFGGSKDSFDFVMRLRNVGFSCLFAQHVCSCFVLSSIGPLVFGFHSVRVVPLPVLSPISETCAPSFQCALRYHRSTLDWLSMMSFRSGLRPRQVTAAHFWVTFSAARPTSLPFESPEAPDAGNDRGDAESSVPYKASRAAIPLQSQRNTLPHEMLAVFLQQLLPWKLLLVAASLGPPRPYLLPGSKGRPLGLFISAVPAGFCADTVDHSCKNAPSCCHLAPFAHNDRTIGRRRPRSLLPCESLPAHHNHVHVLGVPTRGRSRPPHGSPRPPTSFHCEEGAVHNLLFVWFRRGAASARPASAWDDRTSLRPSRP